MIDINSSLRQALSLTESSLRVGTALECDLTENLRQVEGPALELNVVWTALLDNAMAAIPAENGRIRIRSSSEGQRIRVAFVDNGGGIPEDLQRRLFEPFFTTRDVGKGLGLGLFMSRRIIVERFKGEIHIHSEPGKTSVCVLL